MQLETGEIECSFLWRHEFSPVNTKLRNAHIEEPLIVTKFDEDNEYPTNGLSGEIKASEAEEAKEAAE